MQLKLNICLHDTFLELKIVKNGCCRNRILLWLRFRRHFFRHADSLRFKISKKSF